jgi:hypothetical protein
MNPQPAAERGGSVPGKTVAPARVRVSARKIVTLDRGRRAFEHRKRRFRLGPRAYRRPSRRRSGGCGMANEASSRRAKLSVVAFTRELTTVRIRPLAQAVLTLPPLVLLAIALVSTLIVCVLLAPEGARIALTLVAVLAPVAVFRLA